MSLRDIRLERFDQARRYSVAAVARAMGISKPTYYRWERNPSVLTHEQAEKLAEYLGCSVSDIFLDDKVS
jgi:transcriptional regulator with XRE-family HTH domain